MSRQLFGAPASRRGYYPHDTDKKHIRQLRALGLNPRKLSEYHWRLHNKPIIDWWPDRGKWWVQGESAYQGSFDNLLADINSVFEARDEDRECEWCRAGYALIDGRYHDLRDTAPRHFPRTLREQMKRTVCNAVEEPA